MRKRAEAILPMHEQLPDDQYRRLAYFVNTYCIQNELLHHYGWGHLLFACYAALPAQLTPDLLHKMRLNFRHYHYTPSPEAQPAYLKRTPRKPGTLEIAPVAVNDLLLSNLLKETGFEQFEMPETLRFYLLWLLQRSGVLKEQCGVNPLPPTETDQGLSASTARLQGVAAFLKRYADEHYTAPDPLTRSMREAQKWAAESWQDPEAAASFLRERLSEASKPTELYYYSRLGKRLGAQYDLRLNIAEKTAPAGFDSLRTYTTGVAALYEGRVKKAIEALGGSDQLIASELTDSSTPGAVRLPVPREVAQELLKLRPELLEKPLGIKPRHWASLDARLRSPWPKALLSIDGGKLQTLVDQLSTLEQSLQAHYEDPALRLSDYFDLISGSENGAVLATMAVEGKSVAEMREALKPDTKGVEERALEVSETLEESPSPLLSEVNSRWVRQHFADDALLDKRLQNGLLLALENGFNKEMVLTHNLTDSSDSPAAQLKNLLLGITNTSNQGVMFSAYTNPLNSLNLSTIDTILTQQPTFGWELTPDRFLMVSIQADKSAAAGGPALATRAQVRWIERSHLDLMNKYRMRVVQTEEIERMEWPEAWRVGEELPTKSAKTPKKSKALSKYWPVYLESIRGLLAQDELEKAVESLSKMDKFLELGIQADLSVVSEDLTDLKARMNLGMSLSFVEQIASIRDSLTQIIDKIPEKVRLEESLGERVFNPEVPANEALERIVGSKDNLISIAWLDKALQATKRVCRVTLESGSSEGVGVLTQGGYLLTTYGQLPDMETALRARILLKYSSINDGSDTVYELDPSTYYICSDATRLNFAYVKVKDRTDMPLSQWGFVTFESEAPETGDDVFLIKNVGQNVQITDGVVVTKEKNRLAYLTTQESIETGTPIFNNDWKVVAIHDAVKLRGQETAILVSDILAEIRRNTPGDTDGTSSGEKLDRKGISGEEGEEEEEEE